MHWRLNEPSALYRERIVPRGNCAVETAQAPTWVCLPSAMAPSIVYAVTSTGISLVGRAAWVLFATAVVVTGSVTEWLGVDCAKLLGVLIACTTRSVPPTT